MVVAESVGVAFEVEYDGAVQEAVQECGGDGGGGGGGGGGVAEDFAPGADAAVAGEDDRGFQVALGDDLEQGGGGFGGQGQVAEFVDLCGPLHRSTYADPATMPRIVGRCPVAGCRCC